MQDTINYDENPIVIKDKEFKLHIFSFITILPILIYIFKDGDLSGLRGGALFLVLSYPIIKNAIKQRASYFYFTNNQIFRKDDKEVFKEFKPKDIKCIKKSYGVIANPYILKDIQARALFSNWAYRLIVIIGSIFFLIILYLCIQKDFTIFYYTLASVLFII